MKLEIQIVPFRTVDGADVPQYRAFMNDYHFANYTSLKTAIERLTLCFGLSEQQVNGITVTNKMKEK